MNGAEAAVRCLEKEQVEVVFGYPGVAICPFFDRLGDSGIRQILVRQEQNAAHMASGYARITGKTGVVAVTSGPGAENLITGIATAFADSIPMVCITGQVDSRLMGLDVFQEADISGAVESFVKYSYIIRSVSEIPTVFKEAFHIAGTGRKGPVLIDFPCDIQMDELHRFSYPEQTSMRTYRPTVQGNAVQIRKVVAELQKAKRPLLYVGGGVHLSHAADDLRDFAHRYQIPVVLTMMGLSALPTEDPLYLGMAGNNGSVLAARAIDEADLIIVAGARVADRSINRPELITEGKTLIHMDVDPAEIGKNAGPNIPLVGELSSILHALMAEEIQVDTSEWIKELAEFKKRVGPYGLSLISRSGSEKKPAKRMRGVDPRSFIHDLTEAMDEDAVYVADVGQNQLWSCQAAVIKQGRFLTSGGMGTMGYALGAAIGAGVAAPGRQVVAVCGDGAFQMSMMELATARQYGVPVKLVVVSNGWLGLVRQHQHRVYNDHYVVTDLSGSPDLSYIAKAYGMKYLKLKSAAGKEAAIQEFLKSDASILMELMVDPNEQA